jgi:hypothetical protein
MVTDRQRPFPLLVLANLLSNPVRGKTGENPVLSSLFRRDSRCGRVTER